MKIKSFFINLILRIKQNQRSFLFMAIFWLMGVIYYGLFETEDSWIDVILISFGLRNSNSTAAFSNFYQLIWPIIIEVIIFGFLIAVLLEQYNPIATSKIIAEKQKNHTIVLGYQHIGIRIIEFLQSHHKPYVLVEFEEEKVLDLINDEQPVIVADFLEESTLEDAGIRYCKEIFFLTNDFRKAIIMAEKVRKMNKKCDLYMRVFEDEFQDYLEEPPWNAFTFSSSKWTMQSIKQWTKDKTGPAIVLGKDHIAHLIVNHLAREQNRQVYMIDPDIKKEKFREQYQNITLINETVRTLQKLDNYCDITKIQQVFICWKSEEHFQEKLMLTIDLDHHYPDIDTYIRVFDEEVIPIFNKYDGKTFSTSLHAFSNLQKEVKKKSNISQKNP